MFKRPFLMLGALALVLAFSVQGELAARQAPPAATQAPSATASATPTPSKAAQERQLIERYCVTCHNAKLKTGGLALDALDLEKITERADVWEMVVRKLSGGVMPPVGQRRPDPEATREFVSYLTTALDSNYAAHPAPGRTEPLRRLNRTEYKNAIRDLLALDVDVTELLPADDSSSGFDNISLGGLDPARLERYLTAAKKVSRLAVGASAPLVEGLTVLVPSDLPQQDRADGLPFGTRGGTTFEHTFPVDAVYEFQVRLGRGSAGGGIAALTEPVQVVLLIDGIPVQTFTATPSGRGEADGPQPARDPDANMNVRLPIKAGPHQVAATFVSLGARLNEKQRTAFERLHVTVGEDQRTQPTIYSVAMLGPYDIAGAGDSPSRRLIFTCHPTNAAGESTCAREILSKLARHAYRRPVTTTDVAPLLTFYNESRKSGGNFELGIEDALRRLLVSAEFLFRVEKDPAGAAPGTVYRVSDIDLASRMSFFLWSSIPDDELLDVASRGQLKDPAILARQVKRMLADPKADSLVTNFASQWLYLRNLDGVRPDDQIFPDFDESLRQALKKETELFFGSVIREDRSVLDLLRANYSFVNDRLARHYGIPNVYGSQFRRITFPADSPRGGLLGQGAILTVTAYANRTSPVVRGKWVLTNILGTAPPPPPANVPPLADSTDVKMLSMRERMAVHRKNPVCAGCHNMMDPIGLSMENLDAVGRWRDHTDGFQPIDATGSLPDGTKFNGVAELKKTLVARGPQFVSTLTERLMTYGLGRVVDYRDMPAVRKVVRDAAANDFRFSEIFVGIIKSTPFQMKTMPAPQTAASTTTAAH
jgi:mono/diheme cytochrome c family protein